MRRTVLGVLFFLGVTSAQADTTGTLAGQIADTSGAALPGATVTARHLESGLQRVGTSDPTGAFVLPKLPVGAYEVRAEMPGFRPAVQAGVVLVVGQPSVVRLALEPGGVTEELTVTAGVNGVDTRSGELGYLVSENAIASLPLNGRNYTDLIFLQPGVIAYPFRDGGSVVAHGLGASVNGQDPRSNVYLIDGTLMNDFTNGPAGSAANTSLGTETVREFRVEANAYSAEYGRSSGGQVNVLTKSGTNAFHGSAYAFYRNEALDARNFFDPETKPDFTRHQFGATVGGPLRKDRTFFFVGYEGLREDLGRTISSVVPNEAARNGRLPGPGGGTIVVPVSPAVRPYLDAYPLPNGSELGGGLAAYSFPFAQTLDQDYFQIRLDQTLAGHDQLFVRYTFDQADQFLPTDFPQFPRSFVSKNQFATAEYRRVLTPTTLATFRLGYSRTRIGQEVLANVDLPPFVPGREIMGAIDIGGIPRFGPQSSVDVQLRQDVYAFHGDFVSSRGRHLVKGGLLAERFLSSEYNPTFSLGIYTFPSLETFLRNRPQRFIGITPDGDFDRRWPFALFGFYAQDDLRATRRITLNAGLRYEFATLPEDSGGRDVNLKDLKAPQVTVGPLYANPTLGNVSPRLGFAWDVKGDGTTSVRGGYGLYYNTNSQQNLIVTVTNPPFTPRPVIANPTFPSPNFDAAGALSIRPYVYEIESPRVHVWNVNVQRELLAHTVLTLGYAGARGQKLLRNTDANTALPSRLPDGTLFFPAGTPRQNPAFSAIELKTSDGDSWYNALIAELRRSAGSGPSFQVSYTYSRNIDTTQASTFFSDATNGTVSAFPEFDRDYNKGLADYHAKHNLVVNLTWNLPLATQSQGLAGALFARWQVAMIAQYRSGPPLTAFVQANRSRSLWSPSQAPGIGFDRPNLAPGRTPESAMGGSPDQWFDPSAFVLPPAGQLGTLGRGSLLGPDLRVVDLALVKRVPWARLGSAGYLELRVEAFNVLNHPNFGIPSLIAFSGQRDGEEPLPTFGRIRTTVTSARQIQLGLRVAF